MKWPARVFLAAACACVHAVSESELSSGTSESTLTETQCSETVKKVQASGKYTEDAILPICSSEVKSSKCDFFAEALSLASTHTDFAAKVFCKDIAEAHTCSQMMDNLYQSVATRDLLFGECMRSQEGKSEPYCMKFKSLLSRAVHESDLDTMRACYMMQAYDEKEGPIEPKPSTTKAEAKKESKVEKVEEVKKAHPQPSSKKAEAKKESKVAKASSQVSSGAPHKPKNKDVHAKANASIKVPKPAAHKVVAQHAKVSKEEKPAVKAPHQVKASKPKAHAAKPAVAKMIGKHEASKSQPNATKRVAVKGTADKEGKTSKPETHSVSNTTKASLVKTNASNPKTKLTALAKTNATAMAKTNATANMTAEERKADEKKYGGFLSGFVL